MNGEILFRGKPVNQEWWSKNFERFASTEKWVIGNLIVSDGEHWIVGGIEDVDDEYITHEWRVRVRPATVGQYTGLKDRNGVKIFEGDVVKCHHYSNGVKKRIVGRVMFGSNGWSIAEVGHCAWNTIALTSACEVIGSIHDNPEFWMCQEMRMAEISDLRSDFELCKN